MKNDRPQSANEVLAQTREDHNWHHVPEDIHSTGGIQRAITAQWHAIQALADYIDGVATGETNTEGAPIRSEVDGSTSESPRAVQLGPAESVAAA